MVVVVVSKDVMGFVNDNEKVEVLGPNAIPVEVAL
jgi:hypothetical protein